MVEGAGTAPGRAAGGFTLIELLIALFVLSVTLLAGLALVMGQPRVVRRIDAGRLAMRSMETTIEAIRAGVLPLQTEDLVDFAGAPSNDPTVPAANPKVAVTVAPAYTTATDLWQVSMVATYTVYGRPMKRTMQTLVWRPGASP